MELFFKKCNLFLKPFCFFFTCFAFLTFISMLIHSPLHFTRRVSCGSKARSSPQTTKHLFKSNNFISLFVIVLMMIVVEGDDTQALRHTISSLCSLNSVGWFASCCASHNNCTSITLASSTARNCFISVLSSTTGSVLTSLFVICFSFLCFSFSNLYFHSNTILISHQCLTITL